MRVQVAVGFRVASDWFRREREFPGPIIERGETNRNKSPITFDTQSKIAPNGIRGRHSHQSIHSLFYCSIIHVITAKVLG